MESGCLFLNTFTLFYTTFLSRNGDVHFLECLILGLSPFWPFAPSSRHYFLTVIVWCWHCGNQFKFLCILFALCLLIPYLWISFLLFCMSPLLVGCVCVICLGRSVLFCPTLELSYCQWSNCGILLLHYSINL